MANTFAARGPGITEMEHGGADSSAENIGGGSRGEGGGGWNEDARGGDCNLYYPSTISVERIEDARITVITTDTRNNIMRDACRACIPWTEPRPGSPLNEL